uniref:Immunoglobulin-binding protein 1-like isoform X3 n=1 Tax=Saccoglossus kowalevskii TaxID=10224 RepID=A0ABM0M580_SACKO|nr:PREDICTED: immunoglobulin-binding protein 1-like isoform X3 [Saccoglossus kowalevskii]
MLKLTSQDRLSQVQKASVYFKDFLKRCKCYGLTTEDIPNNPSPSSDMSAARPNLMGMAANREMKIKRYREKKEREERLNSLGSPVDITQRDEDVQREYYLLIVKKWISDSLDEYSNVQQEIEILHHMAKMKKISGDAPPSATAPPPTKGRPPPSAQPLKPFILTRDDIQAKVFGAGYPSIPTMTLEDYFQKEIMEGKIQNSSGGQQTLSEREAVEKKEIEKEREIERDDEDALKKARQWDEWRDDHRRGEGNRQNMG